MIKRLIHKSFALMGLSVSRVVPRVPKGAEKYFNTGKRSTMEENALELYEAFYRDHKSLAEYFDEQRLHFYQMVADLVLENGETITDRDVLDVGCGTGHLLTELKRIGTPRSLSGCDFAREAVAYSREHFPGCSFFQHDVYTDLPHSYDVIFCTEVLEHLEKPSVALRNLKDAVRSAGLMVLTVPNGRLDSSIEHINFWSPESWRLFLESELPGWKVKTATFGNDYYNIGFIKSLQP